MNEMEQLVENINTAKDAKANSLSEEELNVIDKAKRIMKERVKVGCTGCGYCMPCPMGVDIPKNFQYYNSYFRFDSIESKKHEVVLYNAIFPVEKHADKCVGCGKCESHCPQEIHIRDVLKEVVATMK